MFCGVIFMWPGISSKLYGLASKNIFCFKFGLNHDSSFTVLGIYQLCKLLYINFEVSMPGSVGPLYQAYLIWNHSYVSRWTVSSQ